MSDTKNLRLKEASVLSRDKANEILRPYHQDVAHCVRAGLTEFLQVSAGHRAVFRNRTSAGVLNDLIVHEATTVFDGRDGVQLVDRAECWTFVFHELLALRFKKIDHESRARNIETARQRKLLWQMPLDGIEAETHVTAGYRLTKMGNEIAGIEITCFYARSCRWKIPIAEDMAAYLIDNELQPTQEPKTPSIQPITPPTVRPKNNVEPRRSEQPSDDESQS